MAEIRGGDKLAGYLSDLAKKVTNASTLKVGFLENATYPDGTSVALVAAVQNFGAPSRGIPPRPFFSNMVAQNGDQWGPMLGELLQRTDMDAGKALALMGEEIKGELRESIIATNAPPLKPATVARKGHDKPLVDTGLMLASVDKEVS